MDIALKVVVPIAAGLILLLVVLKVIVSGARRKVQARMVERCQGQTVIKGDGWASLLGQRSSPVRIRGNGSLVLTEKELIFLLALPAREISIPLRSITSVSHPRSFMGRSVLIPLLVVGFKTEGGEEDGVGWALRGAEDWGREIDRARQ